MSGEQHRFKIKIKCKCAILIQKSARRDSIVSNSNSAVRLQRLFDSIDPKKTLTVASSLLAYPIRRFFTACEIFEQQAVSTRQPSCFQSDA
jgi:hypothetical protein